MSEERTPLELAMLAAWLNVRPDQIPAENRAQACPHTMAAWKRVGEAALEAQAAEIKRLREALKPFAKSGDLLVMAEDKGDFWAYRPAGGDEYGITGRHLLAARAALGEPTSE